MDSTVLWGMGDMDLRGWDKQLRKLSSIRWTWESKPGVSKGLLSRKETKQQIQGSMIETLDLRWSWTPCSLMTHRYCGSCAKLLFLRKASRQLGFCLTASGR